MRKILVSILFVASVTLAYADVSKVAYVNATRVMNEIPQADALRNRIQIEFAPRDKIILDMQADLKKLEDTKSKNSGIMSEEFRGNLERKIFKLTRDIKRAREEFSEDLNIRRNDELAKLQKLVSEAIVSFAKKNDYDLILGDSVLFSSKRVDVTNQVIEYLKAEHQPGKNSTP